MMKNQMRRIISILLAMAFLGASLLPTWLSRAQADAVNLIANPSVETTDVSGNPTNWTPNDWGTSTTNLTVSSDAHTGNKALSVVTTSRTDGDAKWMPDPVAVSAGQTYTYSDYSKATVPTQLDAVYTDASGNVSYNYLETVQSSSNWQQTTVNLTVPANEVEVAIWHILPTAGSLTTDDFSLTAQSQVQTPPPTGSNMIANPSMETANGSAPAGWQTDNWGTNSSNFSYVTNDAHTGSASAKVQITSYTDGDAKWFFSPVAVQPNTQYTFTDWYKSTIASSLVVRFDDGTGSYTYVEPTAPAAASDWTQATATFTTPANAKYVTVLHLIAGVGTLQTDDASLTSGIVSGPAPTALTISAPSNGATVSGGVQVSLTPNQQSGIASIQMQLDGQNLGGPVTAAPWQFSWNTATVLNGSHSLGALLTTTDGKTITAPSVTVKVTNTAATGNLITNPSFETADAANSQTPSDWKTGGWGANTASYSYVNNGHTGSRSTEVQISSWTNGSAYWMPTAAVPVTAGQMYDFSDYYKANTGSELDATFIMADGSQQYMYLGTAFDSPNSWTKYDIQFSAPAGAVSVVLYHDIYSVGYLQTDDFSLTPFKYQGFKRALVSITDDDGFANFYANGLPVLKKYGLKSTDYIISSYLDQPLYMTSAQVKALHTAGMEIGSHSVDHPDLTAMTAAQQDAELKNSQSTLQKLLGVKVNDYAAPYGAFSNEVTTDAAKYYQTYRTTLPGYNGKNNFNAMNLYVQNVTSTTTTADIQGWLQEAKATNTWLVLVYHEVSTTPTDTVDGISPANFDAQMAAVKNSGIVTKTVAQAMTEIKPQLSSTVASTPAVSSGSTSLLSKIASLF